MQFEINIPPLTGTMTAAHLFEVGGVAPTNIVSSNQGFGAHIEWQLCGWLAQFLPGNWRIALLLESMGPGPEYSMPIPPDTVPLGNGAPCPLNPACTCYVHNINIAAGAVNPGTYRAVVALTYEPAPGTSGPIAGHADLGMVQIYA
ncbi:MAG: hypothetical protein SXV54_17225 [Chloroflexota bacterium]|nr:hypothetical protein [Chloroflexota bacterium]